ncbi:MAG: DUF1684 domain-containing protein [Bacteroidia bacterium]|nr:DUF1684 domain-containing protein [Bacteroidia bacterium]
MKKLILLFGLALYFNCSDGKKPIQGETAWQQKMNADFKDATKSPLSKKDRTDFEGLDFYTYNEAFKVDAFLLRTPDSEYFKMKTNTDELREERVYGILSFEINDELYKLNVYQGKESLETPGNEDYLFLPFLDNTNGEETYGGGRYIDLRIPEGDSIEIDFNEAYNPYCVYNEKYSCPIVPRDNYLNLKIEAGVKAFKKE